MQYTRKRFDIACAHFRAFFQELEETFFERQDVLRQFALALLSRQHVLLTGPPGTAKSKIVESTIGRIIDERTGRPSLFARQLGEHSVAEDLIGTLDFKQLTETGRTRYFTDEGMLHAHHAFLDEVLDARGNLLRACLNILNERELKQGNEITKGNIECAFMTSNVYAAEALEANPQLLTAFVDRIRFINYIPRKFSDPRLLQKTIRRHAGGYGRKKLTAQLTIQDLDVLQAIADHTFLPEEICDSVGTFIDMLEVELAEAQRNNPDFHPTRFFSPRTAVQAAQMLRAVAVLRRIYGGDSEPAHVIHEDIEALKLSFLLVGVDQRTIQDRLVSGTDDREKRQLMILNEEIMCFQRCWSRLPKTEPKIPKQISVASIENKLGLAQRTGDPENVAKAMQFLLDATDQGKINVENAYSLISVTANVLAEQVMRLGLTPNLGSESLTSLISSVNGLAASLERMPSFGNSMATWLRRRLVDVLEQALGFFPAVSSETLILLAGRPTVEQLSQQIERRFAMAEGLFDAYRSLKLRVTKDGDKAPEEEDVWSTALCNLERELARLWDIRFHRLSKGVINQGDLDGLLKSLSQVLALLKNDEKRISSFKKSELMHMVAGRRLSPILRSMFDRLNVNRQVALGEVETIIKQLREAGLGNAIRPIEFVTWTATSLIGKTKRPPTIDIVDKATYQKARSYDPALSLTDTLVRVAIASRPSDSEEVTDVADAIQKVLSGLDDDVQAHVRGLDIREAERQIERLEAWWEHLAQAKGVPLLKNSIGFLEIMRGGEPLRIVQELSRVSETLGGDSLTTLTKRMVSLEKASTDRLIAQLESRADTIWAESLNG